MSRGETDHQQQTTNSAQLHDSVLLCTFQHSALSCAFLHAPALFLRFSCAFLRRVSASGARARGAHRGAPGGR
eukprot:7201491-Alexandrium_andersonii.AAC.1